MIDRIAETRNAIAHAIKSVRLACFGRKCLKECQRRMVAAAPCPRATRRRRGAAVAAVLLCLGAFVLEGADVQCIWNGSTYVCSGTGSSIEVIGGGSGLPVVVTNFWGVCTNCVQMSPSQCSLLKDDLHSGLVGAYEKLQEVAPLSVALHDQITTMQSDISTFRSFGVVDAAPITNQRFALLTNYVYTVDNTQTQLVRSYYENPRQVIGKAALIGFNDGVYDYAQTLASPLSRMLGHVETVDTLVGEASVRVTRMRENLDSNLNCEECQLEYEPGPDPGGSGSGVATNGNWCTFDQGEAIKTLLSDLKQWAECQHSQLTAISNFVEQSYSTMRDGLFTSYTHIPTEEDLGMHWQELYLEGYSPNFHEYASTNILARIELLLAGMSGVLTNSSDFAEAGSFAEEGMEPTNELKTVVHDFTNEFVNVIQEREANVRSVGDALVGLYNSFRGWSGTPFSRTTLIGSYSFEIGEQHWDVPSFEPSEKGLWVGNLIRVVCRSVMSVLYILFTVAVFIRFHIAFFQWVLKYLKWGIELMQGLFA